MIQEGDRVRRAGGPDTPGTVGIVAGNIVGVIWDDNPTPHLLKHSEVESAELPRSRWWRMGPIVISKNSPEMFSGRHGHRRAWRIGPWSLEWRP